MTKQHWQKLRHHPKFWPVVMTKAVVTMTVVVIHFAPEYAALVATTGNLLWLWGPTALSEVEEV